MILIKIIWIILLLILSIILIGFLYDEVTFFIDICKEYFDVINITIGMLSANFNKIVRPIIKNILLLMGVLICPIMWISLQKEFIQMEMKQSKEAIEEAFNYYS